MKIKFTTLVLLGMIAAITVPVTGGQAFQPIKNIKQLFRKDKAGREKQKPPPQTQEERPGETQDLPKQPARAATGSSSMQEQEFSPEWGFFNVMYGREFAMNTPGIKWTRFTGSRWMLFEKNAPRKGRHVYTWDWIDKKIRRLQDLPINVVFVIHPTSLWASSEKCLKERRRPGTGCPPLPQYMDDWKEFMRNLLERYDHDGFADMPGLRRPYHYWQIGNEYQSPAWWGGTAEEFLEVLRLAYEAKQAANPDAKIIIGGLTLTEKFQQYEENPQIIKKWKNYRRWVPYYEFSKKMLAADKYFDIVDVHFFHDLKQNPGAVDRGADWVRNTMRSNGYEKPLVCLEWSGAFGHYDAPDPKKFDREILDILNKGGGGSRYEDVRRNFNKAQAEDFARMFVSLLGNGFRIIIHVQFQDFPPNWDERPWNTQGIFQADKRSKKITSAKPSYYTYVLLNSRMDGVEGYRRIDHDPLNHIYQFTKGGKRFLVAWSDQERREVDLSRLIAGRRVTVAPLVAMDKSTRSVASSADVARLTLGHIPVLIQ